MNHHVNVARDEGAGATVDSRTSLPAVGHVLIASDKFKGSLTAAEVGAAVSRGLRTSRPGLDVVTVPVADGGDGTLAAAIAAGYESVPVTASGPTGLPVATSYARLGDRAVVEMADVSGLSRLPSGLAPLTASSRGTGEVIAAALDAGCRQHRARHRRQRRHRRRRRPGERARRPPVGRRRSARSPTAVRRSPGSPGST